MAGTGFEVAGSRRITNTTAERKYRLTGCDDEQDVADFVGGLTATVSGFPFADFNAEELDSEGEGGDYDLSVLWSNQTLQPLGESATSEYRFNFQAAQAKINFSLQTISIWPAILSTGPDVYYPVVNLDFDGSIGVTKDEKGEWHTQGADLPVPTEVFQLIYYAPNSVVDAAYQSLVQSLCGKVNNATFRGYVAGQIMLVRVNGSTKNNTDWNIDFGFGYVSNATNIPVGTRITVESKDGFDYLWVFDDVEKVVEASAFLPRHAGALVERVYERADLSLLNLPT